MRKLLFMIWNVVILGLSLYSVLKFRPNFGEDNEFLLLQDMVVSFVFLPSTFILILGFPSLVIIKTLSNHWIKLTAIVLIFVLLFLCVIATFPYTLKGNLILCFISFIYSMVYFVVAFVLSLSFRSHQFHSKDLNDTQSGFGLLCDHYRQL